MGSENSYFFEKNQTDQAVIKLMRVPWTLGESIGFENDLDLKLLFF